MGKMRLDIEPGRSAARPVNQMRAIENRDAKTAVASKSSPIATFRSIHSKNRGGVITSVWDQISRLHDSLLNSPPESARAALTRGSIAHDGRLFNSAIASRRDPLLKM